MNLRPHRLSAVVALLVIAGIPACGGSDSSITGPTPVPLALTPVAPTAEWPASTPDAEGLDPDVLTDFLRRWHTGQFGSVSSVLVARNDRLVFEEYRGWSAGQAHHLQSVTKSVMSLIAGLAVQDGVIRVADRIVSAMATYEPIANRDAYKEAMTVRDLLTMQSGFDWREWPYAGSPLERLNTCRCGYIRLVLDWPMREWPGTRWEYVSGAPILLAGVISTLTGRRFDDYAAERLFRPLGTTGEFWANYSTVPAGLPHTGGGLFMRPRDMLKLGSLVLNDGRWQGAQILSAAWIRESTRRIVPSPPVGWPHPVDYGYYWWIMSLADPMNARPEAGDVIVASGAQGQWILVAPRYRIVTAVTAQVDADMMYGPRIFFAHVLAAVRR